MTGPCLPETDVSVDCDDWLKVADIQALAANAIAASARHLARPFRPGAEVSVLLTDDATVRALNKSWRRQDKPTNVLSFPTASPDKVATAPMLGDIALAYETVAGEAAAEGKRVADHTTHLVVHGFLHLLGFDHLTDADADVMEEQERRILATLGIADPYDDKP